MKKLVNYNHLEDMKKYIKGLNPDEYEVTPYDTDREVLKYVGNYFNTHLPVDVTAWCRFNQPEHNLIYGERMGDQICFVRDTLNPLLFATYKEQEKNPPMVISTHTSKSVLLPVYQIFLKHYGTEIILRNNFYDWKVSINSTKSLDFDNLGIFNIHEEIFPGFCEGFPKEKIYGSYSKNHSKFTFEIRSDYNLYTFIFLLRHYLKIK